MFLLPAPRDLFRLNTRQRMHENIQHRSHRFIPDLHRNHDNFTDRLPIIHTPSRDITHAEFAIEKFTSPISSTPLKRYISTSDPPRNYQIFTHREIQSKATKL